MPKRTIKIAGAGVAGLTAAINLAKAGYEVEVYEKFPSVGSHYKENPQLLPNWFAKDDVIEELEKCNIKISWLNKLEEVQIYLPNQKIVFYGNKIPVGYTVLRGGENSFEKDLALQAEELGVEIIVNSPIDIEKEKVDIIATGLGKPITVGYGRVYKGNFNPCIAKVFFNPNYTPTIGYGYFFPHNENMATIKISRQFGEEKIDFKESLNKFQKNYLNQEIKEENFLYDFGSVRSFEIPDSAMQSQSFLVGEAAGFQDELFRFGMRYAIISGYLAAKSIIDGSNYDILWKKRFLKEFQRTAQVRRIFEGLKKKNFSSLPEKSEIYIDIKKFKKIWLSNGFNLLLVLYPFYQRFLFNKYFFKVILKLFQNLKII